MREWTEVLVDNPVTRYLAQPFPAFVFLAVIWWATYATDVLRWSISDPIGRTVLDVVFLLVGLLALPTLLTPIAAGARRPSLAPALVRIAGAVVVAAGAVSLGVAMQGPLGLLQASWYGAMGRTWGPDPLVDQARAGVVLVVAGVALLVAVVVVVLVRLRHDATGGGAAGATGGVAAGTTGGGAGTSEAGDHGPGGDHPTVVRGEAGAVRASRPSDGDPGTAAP